MIALGILFFIIGFFMVRCLGVPYIEFHYLGKNNSADKVGTAFMLIGILLLIAGVVKFAWTYLP